MGINTWDARPLRYQPSLERVGEKLWIWLSYMTGEVFYDPSSARGANLHYVFGKHPGETPFVVTVTVPINNDDSVPESTGSTILEQKVTLLQNYERSSSRMSCTNGLHSSKILLKDKVVIVVTPLEDLVLEDGRETLRMSVSYQELGSKFPLEKIEVDMDGITGRVIIWGWDRDEAKIFVGDLV